MLPLIFVLLIAGVALARALRELVAVQYFLVRYPGILPPAVTVTTGFPAWFRLLHFRNLFFMTFIVRAGVQILADHPRLYWKRDCTPGTEWFRFRKAVPTARLWTANDGAVTLPGWLGIPGLRHSIELARWRHFSITLFRMINGIAFYILLFTTDRWPGLVLTAWEVIPNAAPTALQYLSLTFPADESCTRYSSLQQITYFITIFIAAPTSILAGFMQSPAISNRLGWFGRVLNRKRACSIRAAMYVSAQRAMDFHNIFHRVESHSAFHLTVEFASARMMRLLMDTAHSVEPIIAFSDSLHDRR